MNNQPADYVDAREINNPHLKEAANMLRKQQAKIEYFEDKPQCEELFEILKDA